MYDNLPNEAKVRSRTCHRDGVLRDPRAYLGHARIVRQDANNVVATTAHVLERCLVALKDALECRGIGRANYVHKTIVQQSRLVLGGE